MNESDFEKIMIYKIERPGALSLTLECSYLVVRAGEKVILPEGWRLCPSPWERENSGYMLKSILRNDEPIFSPDMHDAL